MLRVVDFGSHTIKISEDNINLQDVDLDTLTETAVQKEVPILCHERRNPEENTCYSYRSSIVGNDALDMLRQTYHPIFKHHFQNYCHRVNGTSAAHKNDPNLDTKIIDRLHFEMPFNNKSELIKPQTLIQIVMSLLNKKKQCSHLVLPQPNFVNQKTLKSQIETILENNDATYIALPNSSVATLASEAYAEGTVIALGHSQSQISTVIDGFLLDNQVSRNCLIIIQVDSILFFFIEK